MPAKGYKTLGEELENVAMRLPRSVLAQVDEHIETLRKTAPWAKVGRSDALRDLVVRGLASLPQPQPTPEAPEQSAEPQQTDKPTVPSAQAGSAPRAPRGATRQRTHKAAPVD